MSKPNSPKSPGGSASSYQGSPASSSSPWGARSARSRRVESSSESDSALGTFGISNVRYRVVTPPRPLPLKSFAYTKACFDIEAIFGDEFVKKAWDVASMHGILASEISHIEITARAALHLDPVETIPTLLIVVKQWTEASSVSWQTVVDEMKRYIDMNVSGNPKAGSLDMSVEMLWQDLVREKFVTPLGTLDEDYARLQTQWPSIRDSVRKILDTYSSTKNRVTCISLIRLGFEKFGNNPRTVYIALNYDSPEGGWPPVLSDVQSFLDTKFNDFGLKAHMEHGVPEPFLFDLLPIEPIKEEDTDNKKKLFNMEWSTELDTLTTKVRAGADIGAATYVPMEGQSGQLKNPPVGTLGAWLRIKFKGRDGWHTFGITNYHVARACIEGFQVQMKLSKDGKQSYGPGVKQNSLLRDVDAKGFGTKDKEKRLVESPTRSKLNYNVRLNRHEIRKLVQAENPLPEHAAEIAAKREEEKTWLKFYNQDKHILGEFHYGSGYLQRTPKNHRLDWALFCPKSERIGQNLLPTKAEWQMNDFADDLPRLVRAGNIIKSPEHNTTLLAQMASGTIVYKIGASTKCTIGKSVGFETVKIAEEKYMGQPLKERESREHAFVGTRTGKYPFCNPGDSGAVVWDADGRAVGLAFRGQPVQQSQSHFAYVTPIEDVFKSIKEMSKGDPGGEIDEIRFLGEV